MGGDAAGNRYYENRVDYPFGQHRWVEPGDVNNFDASQVPPEWHGWLHHINDATPTLEQEYFDKMLERQEKLERVSDAPYNHNIGYQNPYFNFNHMHNQSSIRSRGYGIGNAIFNLPPHAPDGYYTQPGSPYNPHSIRKLEYEGDLDDEIGGGRPYKNGIWKERLMNDADREKERLAQAETTQRLMEAVQSQPAEELLQPRGFGTVVGKRNKKSMMSATK
jgi:NADH:ubiquinone oxidoreductase subunit